MGIDVADNRKNTKDRWNFLRVLDTMTTAYKAKQREVDEASLKPQ